MDIPLTLNLFHCRQTNPQQIRKLLVGSLVSFLDLPYANNVRRFGVRIGCHEFHLGTRMLR
jgi:hypothetical protein